MAREKSTPFDQRELTTHTDGYVPIKPRWHCTFEEALASIPRTPINHAAWRRRVQAQKAAKEQRVPAEKDVEKVAKKPSAQTLPSPPPTCTTAIQITDPITVIQETEQEMPEVVNETSIDTETDTDMAPGNQDSGGITAPDEFYSHFP